MCETAAQNQIIMNTKEVYKANVQLTSIQDACFLFDLDIEKVGSIERTDYFNANIENINHPDPRKCSFKEYENSLYEVRFK